MTDSSEKRQVSSNEMSPYLRERHLRWLNQLLDHYGGQEVDLRKRLDAREVWGDGHENEWRRYQEEAAALRAAIEALQPPAHETFPVHPDPTGKTREPPHCPSCNCGAEPAVQPDSDAEVFTRAVVAGVARWEFFSGSTDQGEVCVGGLRYATRLDVGVPMLGPNLREALERHTCWKAPTQKALEPQALEPRCECGISEVWPEQFNPNCPRHKGIKLAGSE